MAHDDCTATKTETVLSVAAYQNKRLQSAHCLEQTVTCTGFSNLKMLREQRNFHSLRKNTINRCAASDIAANARGAPDAPVK